MTDMVNIQISLGELELLIGMMWCTGRDNDYPELYESLSRQFEEFGMAAKQEVGE